MYVSIHACIYVCMCVLCMYICIMYGWMYAYLYGCMYVCMTTYMYCLYVGFDYTYIDINALAQEINSFLALQVWFQAVAGAGTYDTDSPAITSQPR